MRSDQDRVRRSKGGTNTTSKAWAKKAKATRSKIRRRAGKAACNES